MTDVRQSPASSALGRGLIRFGAGAAVGALVGVAAVSLDIGDRLEPLSLFQSITLCSAAGLLMAGLVLVALSFNRVALAAVTGAAEGPATVKEAALVRLSGWLLALSAALAAAPPLALLATETITPRLGWILVLALATGVVVHAALNWLVWRRADELTRRAAVEAAAVAFLLFEGGFFIWAAAEMFGLAPTVSAWAIWTVMFGLYLVAAIWVSFKRGLS